MRGTKNERKKLKKLKKTFKKVLTNEKVCDILLKLSQRKAANGH